MTVQRTLARLAATAVATLPLAAMAGSPTPGGTVPEPGTWALVALAGVIGVVVARNKRK